jgi:hypothetical protein
LGLHVVRETFADINTNLGSGRGKQSLLNMFQELTRKWYADVPVTAEEGANLNSQYSALMRRLSEDKDLVADLAGLLPDTPDRFVANKPLSEKAFMFGTEVIQLMEDVVNTFRFEQSANFANPSVSGWSQVFHRWVKCDTFYHKVWTRAQSDYQLGLRKFIETLREGSSTPGPPSV